MRTDFNTANNMKKVIIFLFFLSFTSVFSQDLITNTFNRNTTSLNGTWHYIVDPYETGYYNYRYEPYDQLKQKNNSAYYADYHTNNKMELVEYDFDKSPTMLIPSDWNSQSEQLFCMKEQYGTNVLLIMS